MADPPSKHPSVQEAAPHLHRLLAAMKDAAASPRRSYFNSPSRPAAASNVNDSWLSSTSTAYSPNRAHSNIMASLNPPPPPLGMPAAPASLDQFYARLLRALEQEHQRQAWEQQQKHDREMLSLSQRSDRSDPRSDSGTAASASASALSMSGGSGGGGGGGGAAVPPRSPRRIMAGMTMDELSYTTTSTTAASAASAPVAGAEGDAVPPATSTNTHTHTTANEEPVTPTRPARSTYGTPLRETPTPYTTPSAHNNFLDVAAPITSAMAASPLRRVEIAPQPQPQRRADGPDAVHNNVRWLGGGDGGGAAMAAVPETELNNKDFAYEKQHQEQHRHHGDEYAVLGPEVGGRSPRRRQRSTAAELATADAQSAGNSSSGGGGGGVSEPFTGRGLYGSAGNSGNGRNGVSGIGGGGAVGGSGGSASGIALQLARKDAEVMKLTHDIKRLIEQQMPIQQVVRDLVEQCKQLQEENSFLVLDRDDYTTKLQQSEDAEEDSHVQMQQLVEDAAEQRRASAELKRKLAAAEDDFRMAREDEESVKGLQGGLVAKNAELVEKTLVLEAKIADLKGERGQLKDEIKRVNKSLDRMRWPAGTILPNELSMIGDTSEDVASVRSSATAASFAGSGDGRGRFGGAAMIPSSLPVTAGFMGSSTAPFTASASSAPSARATTGMHSPKISISNNNNNHNSSNVATTSTTTSSLHSQLPQLQQLQLPSGSAGSVTSSMSLSSSLPNSMFHFPRAPNANTESDFNIFTGEPQDHGVGHRATRHPNIHKQRNYPTTRMSWAVSESRRLQQMDAPPAGLPSGASVQLSAVERMRMRSSQLGAEASGQPYDLILPDRYGSDVGGAADADAGGGMAGAAAHDGAGDVGGAGAAAIAGLSAPSSLPKPIAAASSLGRAGAAVKAGKSVRDPVVRSLLEDSIKDKARERRQLEKDMAKGNYDAEAQIMAAKRILELDRQALDLQNRLME